tara:strand:+ start:25883 stop:26653 length:771 start_codon:yes stop_codon:yes gene_type:complete
MSISTVIITKNEEKNIARAIESCLPISEEILILDSGSSDQTLTIAASYEKVKVHQVEWQGFSATKNLGNKMATGEYILSLDADEALSDQLQEEIKGCHLDGSIYRMPRLTNYCGQWIRHSGWRPDYQTRLFPKDKAHWNASDVHEKLEYKGELKSMQSDLLHYSYYSISDHLQRIDSYTELGAKMVIKRNPRFLLAQAILRSKFKFLRMYILKLGFLDGFYGFVIAVIGAYVVFIKYIKAASHLRQQRKLGNSPHT